MKGALAAAVLVTRIAAGATVDFDRQVHPILAARCFACHGGDKRSGGLSLSSYSEILRGGKTGKVVNPGSAKDSLLVERVLAAGVPPMPPVGERLSAPEIDLLKTWIDEGARPRRDAPPARANWVPRMALVKPPLPAGADPNPVDRLLLPYFLGHNIQPPRRVANTLFARRAYLDAWGLVPTPEQLAAFETSTDRNALVSALLANENNYSEHWITFWNDLLRNEEGVNYAGTRKSITAWLLKSLRANLPYNQFVAELLSPVGPSAPDGFLTGVNWRGDVNASQTPVMQAAQNSAQVFLGVNLKCNSCHDSFISRWKLKDAYGLAGFFADERLELVRCDVKLGQFAEPKFLYPELGGVDPMAPLPERRAAAARLFTSVENGRFARTIVNRIWKQLMGRGLVEPVDDMDAEPWNPELLDWLAADFVEHGYNLKSLIEQIMTSRAYQSPAVDRNPKEESEYVFRGPALRRITAEQFMDALSSITGEWRVLVTRQAGLAPRSREWRFASSPLSRGLGRPIRDQVFTGRATGATTLQALELVNGETLTRFLRRASKRMLGELPPAPPNLFDSGHVNANHVNVDIDITGVKQLRLLVADIGSYSPERVLPVWAEARLTGPDGVKELGEPVFGQMKFRTFASGLRTKLPSELVLDIAGKGYTRFEADVGLEAASLANDINPHVRFFVFDAKPDMEELVKASPEIPVAPPPKAFTVDSLTARLYRQALARDPTPKERLLARNLLTKSDKISDEGLADLIWCIVMLPEFQLIQ
jgi:Protein of unknown function (DUF1553)./Protein of unknown function (DUF1549)./Planctomycete cytochrome C.